MARRVAMLVPRLSMSVVSDLRAHVGLFAGLSLEGTAIVERKDANHDFYGSFVPAKDILGGRVPPPEVASRLYEVIEAAEGVDETGLAPPPEHSHSPRFSQEMVFDAGVH